ncbi:hypothetical protein HK096_009307 [Nowakowskiella sp. JEL0078]|nr:hypothetical protein HK096_009307 [Nowakowskiella sp. JEL0078]
MPSGNQSNEFLSGFVSSDDVDMDSIHDSIKDGLNESNLQALEHADSVNWLFPAISFNEFNEQMRNHEDSEIYSNPSNLSFGFSQWQNEISLPTPDEHLHFLENNSLVYSQSNGYTFIVIPTEHPSNFSNDRDIFESLPSNSTVSIMNILENQEGDNSGSGLESFGFCGPLYCPGNFVIVDPEQQLLSVSSWDDGSTKMYILQIHGHKIARRFDNHKVNGTKLLNFVGISRGKRDRILKSEQSREVVRCGSSFIKGVWLEFSILIL